MPTCRYIKKIFAKVQLVLQLLQLKLSDTLDGFDLDNEIEAQLIVNINSIKQIFLIENIS